MKPLLPSALLMRIRYHLAKQGAIVRSVRNGGGVVVVIDGETSRLYPSLEALGRELSLIRDTNTWSRSLPQGRERPCRRMTGRSGNRARTRSHGPRATATAI